MKKERGYIESFIRYFEPIKHAKMYSFQQICKGVTSWSNPFIHVFFIQAIVGDLESSDILAFQNSIFYYVIYVVAYELVHWVTYYWGWFALHPEIRKILGNKYISKYIELDNTVTERIGTGKSISVIDKGIEMWASGISLSLWNGAGLIASFIIALWYLSSVHFLGSLVFLAIFIGALCFSASMNKKMLGFRKKRHEQDHLHTKYLVKLIMGKFEFMQGGAIENETKKLSEYMDKSKYFNLKMSPYFHAFYHVPLFLLVLLKISFLYYMSSYIFAGEIGIATFVGVFATMLILEETVMRFVNFFKEFSKNFAMVDSLWDFFDTTPQITGYEEGNEFIYKTGSIELRNIHYSYDESKPVFTDLSLTLQGQKVIALVGPSGGGKSTLVKLISGYIKANSGEILVDGQKLSETSLKSYYQSVGYLTQEPSVFDGSVRENLMYGTQSPNSNSLESTHLQPLSLQKRGADKKAQPLSLEKGEDSGESGDNLKNIITLAHCEFIYDLPNGLDTEIGERGVKLSGGQKQRLAIAKIFLKDPKIIILDEPTSALDSVSEKKITQAMHNLFKNRTVIVIAHRLQTVKHADDILVIGNGEIIERGTHTELTKLGGFYKEMLDLQSGF